MLNPKYETNSKSEAQMSQTDEGKTSVELKPFPKEAFVLHFKHLKLFRI
jgi:hypothetical protein